MADADSEPTRPARRRRWLRRAGIGLLAALVLLSPVEYSIGRALTAPGTDSAAARLAEWLRGHHAGGLVTWAERIQYDLHPPKVGGTPPPNSPLQAVAAPRRSGAAQGTTVRRARVVPDLPPPAPIPPVASPPLPGEGRWHVLLRWHGQVALRAAYLRPDATHTSYTAGAVWIDPRQLRAVFHPGSQEPGGGPWSVPSYLPSSERTGLVAAFNSAFRIEDSRGGFYDGGRTVRPLRQGAASLVINRDGSMTVGSWGRDVRMSPQVAVVRQNLTLLVDGGRVDPTVSSGGSSWGATIGNAAYVWRSGIGVTATGATVYVAGNALSAVTLADLLRKAGCIRAMELDINPDWTSFILYGRAVASSAGERNLLPDMYRSASRYDTVSSRDFVALYLR